MIPLRLLLVALLLCVASPGHAQFNFGGNPKAQEAVRFAREADALVKAQRYADAVALLRKSVALEAELHGEDARVLNGLRNLSYAQYKAALYKDALATDERRLRIAVKALGEKHAESIAVLRDVAIGYENTFDDGYARATPLLEKALRLRTEVLGERHPDTLGVLNDLANAYTFTGRNADALVLHERKLRMANAAFGADHEQVQGALLTLAVAYSDMGREAEANAIYRRNMQATIAKFGEKSRDGVFAMMRLAGSYTALGQHNEALPLAQKALRLRREVFPEKDRETIHFLESLAAIYTALDRPAEALPLYAQAVKLYTDDGGPRSFTALGAISRQARCLELLGRMDEALKLHQGVLAARTQVQGAQHPDTIGSLVNLARIERRLGHEAEARELYAKVVPAVETLRANADLSPENRQALFAQWVGAYKAHAALLVAAGQREEAFRLAELSKARTLLESTAMRRANQWDVLTAAERTSIQTFEARIAKANDAIAASRRAEQKLALEADKNRVLTQFSAFRRDLARKYPKYAQLSDVKIVGATEGRTVLPDDALFVSYVLDGDRPIVFTLSREDFDARLLDEIPKLAGTVEAYRRVIAAPGGDKTEAALLARQLGQLLLAPIAERLRGRKRVIISLDGALALLPFETLPVGGRMLIADHDVSYTQSLSMLALLKSRDEEYRGRTERKDLLVMGNAIYEPTVVASAAPSGAAVVRSADRSGLDIGKMAMRSARDPQGVRGIFASLKFRWSNLPGTETEIAGVAGLFARERTAVFTQRDATEAKLIDLNKRQQLRDYRYLLFSAHGYLSMEEPALSSLVLGQQDRTPGTDGYVTAAEWPSYDLASDLVVLSACDTGLGKVVQGEGVMGLPYALFVAGNKNTLLSLWPVADESTAEFMKAFFTRLQKGATQAAALNDTKREFIAGAKYGHTIFWAPFLLYGY